MDVPFHSSGAMSRAHYALVRKVESATSIQSADQDLFLQVKSIQAELSHPKLSLDKCKECVVILLYCFMSVTPGFLPADAFDFAFPHAINLAETGRTTEEKRIGYLFCSEMIPLNHELKLMLINTLRKDLECEEVPYICLALDNLISAPSEDVIPAVQSRLHDLLLHDYSCVRRRALLAFRSLSIHNHSLLDRIHGKILNFFQDPDSSVINAALVLASDSLKGDIFSLSVNGILKTRSSFVTSNQSMMLRILNCLLHVGLKESNIAILFDMLLEITSPRNLRPLTTAIVLGIFRLFREIKVNVLMDIEKSKPMSTVQCIRHWLTSNNPDEVYFFVSCLENIHVTLWAGTTPEHAAVLDGLEFERIMELLNSSDEVIRRKTMRIVNMVDPTILESQVSIWMDSDIIEKATIMRILEVASIRHEKMGNEYAGQVIQLVRHLDEMTTAPQVFKEVIEAVLTGARASSNSNFLASCANRFMDDLVDQDIDLGPTALVIATALSTEFSGSFSIQPIQLLSALASRLKSCAAIVQEPCLIALIRIRADCDEVPLEVIAAVRLLSQSARRPIKLRCAQFLEFLQNRKALIKILNGASSSSLPDFLVSLERYSHESLGLSGTTAYPPRSSSQVSGTSRSLNYAAYDPPEVGPSLRARRMSNSQLNISSSRSFLSDTRHHAPPILPITAGHLALADGLHGLQIRQDDGPFVLALKSGEPEAARVDLINLESPYPADSISAPFESSEAVDVHQDFRAIWDSFHDICDLRGWCNAPIDTVIRRLQRVDQQTLKVISAELPPFIGELKVVINSMAGGTNSVDIALRLRESDEDSCLWRLRTEDAVTGKRIQTILNS